VSDKQISLDAPTPSHTHLADHTENKLLIVKALLIGKVK